MTTPTLSESRAWANARARDAYTGRPTDHAAYDAATTDTVDLIHQRVLRFGSTRPRVGPRERSLQVRMLADTAQFEAAMAELSDALTDVTTTHAETDRILGATPPSPWSRFRAWVKEQVS